MYRLTSWGISILLPLRNRTYNDELTAKKFLQNLPFTASFKTIGTGILRADVQRDPFDRLCTWKYDFNTLRAIGQLKIDLMLTIILLLILNMNSQIYKFHWSLEVSSLFITSLRFFSWFLVSLDRILCQWVSGFSSISVKGFPVISAKASSRLVPRLLISVRDPPAIMTVEPQSLHGWTLQACTSSVSPTQAPWPTFPFWHVRVLRRFPPPQVASHSVQALQSENS